MKTMILAAATLLAFGLPALAQQGNPGAHMLEQWDADADGAVTATEAKAKRAEVFDMFDSDSDGTLSTAEWDTVAQHMDGELGAKGAGNGAGHGNGPGAAMHDAMTPAFNDADADGTVTLAEFTAATDKLFPMLDRNADGVVTTDDFGRN